MAKQMEIKIKAKPRGFHIITDQVIAALGDLPSTGILNLFIQHTSAGLTINENADSSVRLDFESIFNKLVPENQPYHTHILEGADDMPAHIKSSLVGTNIQVPITSGKLNLGTWQGIYLCEFRNHGGSRRLVATVLS